MSILSLDVGFSSTGYVVWENKKPVVCGVIKTEATTKKTTRVSDDNANRSMELASALNEIIKKHNVKGIVGELPHGGAQSARAIAHMALATGIVSAVAAVCNVPCEWCTPVENKKTLAGSKSASKVDMMNAAIDKCNGTKRSSGRGVYYKLTEEDEFPASSFEHIADAVGAYYALENGTLVRLLS